MGHIQPTHRQCRFLQYCLWFLVIASQLDGVGLLAPATASGVSATAAEVPSVIVAAISPDESGAKFSVPRLPLPLPLPPPSPLALPPPLPLSLPPLPPPPLSLVSSLSQPLPALLPASLPVSLPAVLPEPPPPLPHLSFASPPLP
jgi:hypothetical protein